MEQQAATSEILRVISSSPTNVGPVFAAVAASATRLCDAFDAAIFQVDASVLRLVAHEGPVSLGPVGQFTVPLVRGSLTGRVAIERRTIQVADHQAEKDEYPEGTAIARRYGVRTMLGVPLLRAGAAVGVIALRRAEVRPFTDRQVELLKTFADQAVIAIENVRLFKELEARNAELTEALEQQTATAEILRVISSSPTDVVPVFETIARNAVRLCDAVYCAVFRVDGDRIDLVAHHNMPPEGLEELRRRYPAPLSVNTGSARAARERAVVQISDVGSDPTVTEARRQLARMVGYRSQTWVPMLREDRTLGVIAVSRREPEPFPDQHIALLRTFADQAVIAVENVRLFTELQDKNHAITEAHAQVTEALEQQTATAEILRVISSSPIDLQPVFDTIVRNAVKLCGAAFGGLQRLDGGRFTLDAQYGVTADELAVLQRDVFPLPVSRETATGRAILDGVVVHIPDIREDPDFRTPRLRTMQGFRTILGVPMMREGIPIGALALWRRAVQPFSESEIGLVQTFADQAVIAIENVRLFNELQARNRELTEALEQQTATSDILRVISSSPTDIQPTFEAIAASARRLCEAAHGMVFRFDGELIHLAAHDNVSPEQLDAVRSVFPIRPGRGASPPARY